MSWTNLLATRTVQTHATSTNEITNLRQIVNRDLDDASIDALSADRRFATAYNAVLQLVKMAVACAGYRITSGAGHHQKSFEAIKTAIGTVEAENLADYFDLCRRKRNDIDYDYAEVVTETEAEELLEKAKKFQSLIEEWIAKNHPTYKI
jgi:uncharacterized protein (UPF0332 family)